MGLTPTHCKTAAKGKKWPIFAFQVMKTRVLGQKWLLKGKNTLVFAFYETDQMKKSVEKFAGGKHKKVEQALGLSMRNLFEQLAWRTSPAAVRT